MGRTTENPWTDAEKTELEQRWREGESASVIAEALGRTRNAIIGRVHRQFDESMRRKRGGGRPRGSRNEPKLARFRNFSRPVVLPALPAVDSPELERADMTKKTVSPVDAVAAPPNSEGRVTILDLRSHHCRWPFVHPGAVGGHLFCGEPVAEGCPYCAEHARRAYSMARAS